MNESSGFTVALADGRPPEPEDAALERFLRRVIGVDRSCGPDRTVRVVFAFRSGKAERAGVSP